MRTSGRGLLKEAGGDSAQIGVKEEVKATEGGRRKG